MAIYKVRYPIVAARRTAQGGVITESIPIDELIKLAQEPPRAGIVEILWQGQHARAFAQDIVEYAELMNA